MAAAWPAYLHAPHAEAKSKHPANARRTPLGPPAQAVGAAGGALTQYFHPC